MEMTTGLIAKLTALETVVSGFDTVMLAVPTAAIRLAGTAALKSVALENVVESGEPFHCTVAPERKPVPVTARVKAGPPAVVELGASDVIAGGAGAAGRLWMAIAIGVSGVRNGDPGTDVRAPV